MSEEERKNAWERERDKWERERASVSVLFSPKNDDKLVLYKSSKSQP